MITRTQIEACGLITLTRYNDGETFLCYEVRKPSRPGFDHIARTKDLEEAARWYWEAIQTADAA